MVRTDRQAAEAALDSVATLAAQLKQNLPTLADLTVLDEILSGNFDAKALAMTRIAEAGPYRPMVDGMLASPQAVTVTPQHAANLQAAADALDAVLQQLANFGVAVRDAKSDIP